MPRSTRLADTTAVASFVLLLVACKVPAGARSISEGVPWRPAAFDDCRIGSRVQLADVSKLYLVLMSNDRPARLCVIAADALGRGHEIVLQHDLAPVALGVNGDLVWLYDAALREVVFLDRESGGVRARKRVPTLEPSLFPRVLSASEHGEGLLVHVPTDTRSDRLESIVARASGSGRQQVVDSLRSSPPTVMRARNATGTTIEIPVPWARHDLVSRFPGGLVVLLRQTDFRDRMRPKVTMVFATGERRTRTLDQQTVVAERPENSNEEISSVLPESGLTMQDRATALTRLQVLANAARPYPLYARMLAIDRARILLQRAWPHLETWECRDEKMQVIGWTRIPVEVTVFGANRSGIWGLTYDTSRRPLLVWYPIPVGQK